MVDVSDDWSFEMTGGSSVRFLTVAVLCGGYSSSSTVSAGRQARMPLGVSTTGRFRSWGCSARNAVSWASVHLGLARSSSA